MLFTLLKRRQRPYQQMVRVLGAMTLLDMLSLPEIASLAGLSLRKVRTSVAALEQEGEVARDDDGQSPRYSVVSPENVTAFAIQFLDNLNKHT